jgi:hypothetical protein
LAQWFSRTVDGSFFLPFLHRDAADDEVRNCCRDAADDARNRCRRASVVTPLMVLEIAIVDAARYRSRHSAAISAAMHPFGRHLAAILLPSLPFERKSAQPSATQDDSDKSPDRRKRQSGL